MSIKIGSFNFKNRPFTKLQKENMNDNAFLFASILKEKKFDFIGTQELTIGYVNKLTPLLEDYQFYGGYRYGNLLARMPYNENNNIITKQKVILSKTVFLPWIPKQFDNLKTALVKMSMMPRIATIVLALDSDSNLICMINTHLDYQISEIQKRQLVALKSLIMNYKKYCSMVITGDFNMDLTDLNFGTFVSDLENEGIYRVPISENTWYGKEKEGKTLDHIFLSKDWYIEDIKVESLEELSDHKLLYVKAGRSIL